MSAIRLNIEVLGETQIDRTFLRLTENASNLQPLFERMLKTLQQIEEVQFLTEGAHGSGGWAPLKDSTLERKKALGLQPWIERATGELFKSLTSSSGGGSLAEVTKEYMRFGTNVPYAGFQQSGTRNMPQRRLIQLTETDRRELTKMVQRYIVTGEV